VDGGFTCLVIVGSEEVVEKGKFESYPPVGMVLGLLIQHYTYGRELLNYHFLDSPIDRIFEKF
jgi:hypothetical protein